MNINCIICADLFIPSAEIYTTRCGHIFHYLCLMRWFERSKTCPQCRQKTNDKSINRIYFNFATAEGVVDDVVSLQNKLDSLALNLRMKEADLKKAEENFQKSSEENSALTVLITENKAELDKCKSAIGILKEQLLYAKVKAKEAEKVEDELKQAKEKCIRLEHINKGITGSYEDAQDVARNCQDIKTLSQIMVSLKNEVKLSERKKDKLFHSLKRAERDLQSARKEVEHYKKEADILNQEIKGHEKCETERQALRKRIEEMTHEITKGSKIDPTIQRVLQESPMPQLTRPKKNILDNTTFEIVDSPDVPSRVKAIKESDSPYLQIKSNSMGMLLHSQGLSSRIGGSASTSIFKTKRIETQVKPKAVPDDVTYDGMGGHERSLFSSRSQFTQGLKRQKSSTSISSSKFRKLANPQNNKLNDYLNISDIE